MRREGTIHRRGVSRILASPPPSPDHLSLIPQIIEEDLGNRVLEFDSAAASLAAFLAADRRLRGRGGEIRDAQIAGLPHGRLVHPRSGITLKMIISATRLSPFTWLARETPDLSVTGRYSSWPPGMTEETYRDIRHETDEDRIEAAHLSGNSKFINDPDSGHNMQIDDPQIVADAGKEVVKAVREHGRLTN